MAETQPTGTLAHLRALARGGARLLERRVDGWASEIIPGRGRLLRISEFIPLRDLADAELEALYVYSDFAARIVAEIPNERMRQGVTIAGDPEGALYDAANRFGLLEKVTEAWVWGRLYGGGAVFVAFGGDQSMPMRDEDVRPGSLRSLLVIEKRDLQPHTWVTDIASPDYGEPETYLVTMTTPGGSLEMPVIHRSRLVMFGGVETTRRRKAQRGGWDDSVLQRVWSVLRDVEENWSSSVHILKNLSQAVYKIKDLAKMMSAGRAEDLKNRMGVVDATRSVYRAIMLDAEMESFEQVATQNVSAVPLILDKTWQRLAAAAGMPVTKLMGMSPGGLNATGESDLANWYGLVEAEGAHRALPQLRRLVRIVARSETPNVNPDEVDVEFPSLWQMTPKETAELRNLTAQTDALYVQSGILLPHDVTLSRFGKGEWSAETVIDLELAEAMQRETEAAMLEQAAGPGGASPAPEASSPPPSTEPR